MRKKMKLGSALLMVTLSWSAMADSASQELKQKLEQLKTYSATFVQQVTDVEGELLQESTGKILMAQPNKLRWQTNDEDGNVLLADGENLWHMDPLVEQVIVMSQKNAVANNPMILLTEPDSAHWKKFSIEQQGATFIVSALTEESSIKSLVLTFSGQTLIALTLLDRQQQASALKFTDIQQNSPLESSQFTFTLPKGYDLDDQR